MLLRSQNSHIIYFLHLFAYTYFNLTHNKYCIFLPTQFYIIACIICRTSIYIGPSIFGRHLIEESKQFKINNKIIDYNLDNDDLFGRPLSTKWEKLKKYL